MVQTRLPPLISSVLENSGKARFFEGSGTFIVESDECAAESGHVPVAEIASYGWGRRMPGESDAEAVREAASRALQSAGIDSPDAVLVCDTDDESDEVRECMKLGVPVIMPLKNTGSGLAAGTAFMTGYALELLTGNISEDILYATGSGKLDTVPSSLLINGRSINGSRISVTLKSGRK